MRMERCLWAALCLCGLSNVCAAQLAVEAEVEIERELDVEVMVMEEGVVLHEGIAFDFFEDWIFQGLNEEELRTERRSQLESRLGDLRREAELTEAQFRKLDLAGRCDIKRLFERIAACRTLLPLASKETADIQRVGEELQSLQREVANPPFEESSLFDKAAQTVLRTEQLAQHVRLLRQIQSDRRQTQLAELLSDMESSFDFTDEQRDQLQKLFAELPPFESGRDGYLEAMLAAAQLPEESYRAILNAEQWESLRMVFEEVRQSNDDLRLEFIMLFHAQEPGEDMEEEELTFEVDPMPEDG